MFLYFGWSAPATSLGSLAVAALYLSHNREEPIMTIEGRELYIELRKQANHHVESILRNLDEIQRLHQAGVLCDRWLGVQVMTKFPQVFSQPPSGVQLMSREECRETDELLGEGYTLGEAVAEKGRRKLAGLPA